jgi:hypothetical protein
MWVAEIRRQGGRYEKIGRDPKTYERAVMPPLVKTRF